jgi:hypothetical protein
VNALATSNAAAEPQTNIKPQDPLTPLRGLVIAFRRPGDPATHAITPLKKWLKLSLDVFKLEKVDVLARTRDLQVMPELLAYAAALNLRVSLRITPDGAPPDFAALATQGLLDVHLAARVQISPDVLHAWVQASADAGLPVRVTLAGPPDASVDLEALVHALSGTTTASVALYDPFIDWDHWYVAEDAGAAAAGMNELVRLLALRGVDSALLFVPFCRVAPENFPRCVNWQQYWLDHQQYHPQAYQAARQIQGHTSSTCDKVLENLLTRQTSFHNLIDDRLLPWILNHPWLYIRVWAFHKLTRHLRLTRQRPEPLPETMEEAEAAVAELRVRHQATLGPECARCSLQRICDHPTEAFKQILPGLGINAFTGEAVVDPLHYRRLAERHLDPLDEARRVPDELDERRAERAAAVLQEQPTREVTAEDYAIEDHMTFPMPGSVRWYSLANAELQSTVLARLQPPFAVAYTVGGGYAALAGFSFGRHAKILCPMIGPSHRMALHVDEEGRYSFFRDAELVRPIHFSGASYVPRKLAGVLEPRISLWNIDGQVVTQNVLLWERQAAAKTGTVGITSSVIIISSFYSRRLQAVLTALAHQQGVDWGSIEVIVGYIPGIDATDDLIDSMHLTHPHLRILRAPFARPYVKSKGFMINECGAMASGEWIVLMDSDIVAPPDLFAQIERHMKGAHYLAPEGRKMLTAETTAKILLGEVRPWECYDALLETAGDYRHRESDGVPPGFLQCARRDVFEATPYTEFDHFEGADWYFSRRILDHFGPERRMEGMKVLHLDHGGSQWYGAAKQM